MSNNNELPDHLNPKFIFNGIHTNLLVDAINGKLNLQILAMNELTARGLNIEGNWVGFENAEKLNSKSNQLKQ